MMHEKRGINMKKKQSAALLVILVIVLISGCKEAENLADFGISNYSVGKDTLTIEFTRDFTFTPPRTVTFASTDYEVDVFTDEDSPTRIAHYGLLDSNTDSFTLVMLPDFDHTGDYVFKMYTGDFLSPIIISETESFTFASWSNENDTEVAIISEDADEILFSVFEKIDVDTEERMTGLTANDFLLFAMDGTPLDFNFTDCHAVDNLVSDGEYSISLQAGTFTDMLYYLRFAKAGYNPDTTSFNITE